MSTIELHDVTLTYDVRPVLDHIDLAVDDGEFLVLVGPSGSGKTTALRIVAGLLRPTSGQVLVGGRDVTKVPPADRDLAMVFQSYALYPHMTVRNNMAFGLRLGGVHRKERDARVERAAEILGLTDLLDRRPKALSGGQRQRVAMGRAIVREPQAFLMDEPLSNLDAKLRTQVRAQIARIQRDLGITTLYVTHDQIEAMTMADRIAVLHEGRLQQLGTPDDLFSRPANVFVAAFIGSPPTNLIPGTLTTADGQTALRVGGQTLVLPPRIADAVGASSTPDVLVGVRPHDVEIKPPDDAALILEVDVDLVERLGTETLTHGEMVAGAVSGAAAQAAQAIIAADDEIQTDSEKRRFTAALDPRTLVSTGARVPFYVSADRLHLFDAETGATLQTATRSLAAA
ncbi:ABC transporter ATP-binding protein [Frankia sp. CNm7]|uniref:ABC transporter ATP-binding protein n=1 Tax=Frankia nepalensis TaxID=1836974 RepID=A0A937RSF8_9ACTN|nr:ABC transporter ATP-binding protein [Frankia nepalensis]MBL7497282.1 ABC transporter ATP-binding protein [Frankia nepalensis]MBL7512143.1 ABC transporter ATP-binding protein [Frankia nepalensis]MBL7520368.1 ABC transporter ATP-binding protein [Frankia nepalensis]MBL7631913.1 ABC transporter ATP-binding protein [Frankia nepalensis]